MHPDGDYGYLVHENSGKIQKFSLEYFEDDIVTLDLEAVDSRLKAFRGAFISDASPAQLYLPPSHGIFTKVDLSDFTTTGGPSESRIHTADAVSVAAACAAHVS